MNKKISLGLAIAMIFVSITATFAITMTVSQDIYNKLISQLSKRFELYSGIYEIDNNVRNNYFGDFDDSAVVKNSAEGYVLGLNDPDSYYMTAEEYVENYRKLKGEGGIGVTAEYNSEKRRMVITEVYAGSSAEKAELKAGDVIVAVDNENVTASNYNSMLDILQFGRKFDSVSIEYKRGDASSKVVSIVRGETRTVTSSVLGETGYIRITAFYENTAAQFKSAVDELNAQGVLGLIIDVRDCSDGRTENAEGVVDLLVPSGADDTAPIATALDKDGASFYVFTSDTNAITFPKGIVVLTNGNTSGGGELVAAQLKDFSKCTVIGTTSRGRLTMQKIFDLSDGSAISLTVAKVRTYSGSFYVGTGITPDTEVLLGDDQTQAKNMDGITNDSQLQAAYLKLTETQ